MRVIILVMSCMVSLFAATDQVKAGFMTYDSGLNEWSVTGWAPNFNSGRGAFAPGSFTGYTSINGVAMLRNDDSRGWWIGDVRITTYSSHYADDAYSITVTGATWGGIVPYVTTQSAGSRFYAASDNPSDIIDATFLNIGDSVNGVFTWSGSDFNKQLNYNALAAVPEPTSFAVFAIGACVVGLGATLRRRLEKKAATA